MALEHDLDTDLAMAVRKAGSQSEFGRLVGKRQSTIRQWLLSDKVSPESVLKVEEMTGISRHRLRPDVYGPEPTDNTDPPPPFPDLLPRTDVPAPGADAASTNPNGLLPSGIALAHSEKVA